MYIGRGDVGAEVDTNKAWTTQLWSDISAHVPEDGVPLMIGLYSDGFTAAKRSHHPIKCVMLSLSLWFSHLTLCLILKLLPAIVVG